MKLADNSKVSVLLISLFLLISGTQGAAAQNQSLQVTGLPPGDTLNVRTGPSTRYAIVGTLLSGDIVNNHGCRQEGSANWCHISATSGLSGWASARYLSPFVVGGTPNPPVVPNPPSGEPAFWRVKSLGGDNRMDLRQGPSLLYPASGSVASRDVVRNLGCTANPLGILWCQVSPINRPGRSGWISSLFIEAHNGNATQLPGGSASQLPGGTATQLPGNGPGVGFDASGTVQCTFSGGNPNRNCNFQVRRRGNGNATVVISMPGGGQRSIEFEAGRPISSNSPAGMYGEHLSDIVKVYIGTNEVYWIPDAVMFGG